MSNKLDPEYESLLALKGYLNKSDGEHLEEMVKEQLPVNEINIWVNNILTMNQIKNTKVRTAAQAAMEYKEYEHLLNPEEKQWIKKFYHERYANAIYNIPKEYLLHNTEEMIKESNRITNNHKNDVYDVNEKRGLLLELDDNRYLEESEEPYCWEQAYSCFGYDAAVNFLVDECLEELKIKNFDNRLALIRYYIKMNRLRLANNRDKRNPKRKDDK